MFKLKKLVVVLVAILLVMGICIQVSAVDNPIDVSNLLQQNATTNTANPVNNLQTNTPNINAPSFNTTTGNRVNNTGGSVVQPEDNAPAVNKLPQTGVTEDITVMFFIIVCGISAIYAYRKIRDYKG